MCILNQLACSKRTNWMPKPGQLYNTAVNIAILSKFNTDKSVSNLEYKQRENIFGCFSKSWQKIYFHEYAHECVFYADYLQLDHCERGGILYMFTAQEVGKSATTSQRLVTSLLLVSVNRIVSCRLQKNKQGFRLCL